MKVAQVPMLDDRKTGYQYLQKTASGAFHSGEDLNYGETGWSDHGGRVGCMGKGKVIYAEDTTKGYGQMIVVFHPQWNVWSRYMHLSKMLVEVGQLVEKGEKIGECGKTGTTSPHCHWDVIKKRLAKWDSYVNGWSRAKVKEYYESPYFFVEEANKKANQIPEWGYAAMKYFASNGIINNFDMLGQPLPMYQLLEILRKNNEWLLEQFNSKS